MQSRTKGILAIVASALGFALMALFVRLCDDYGAPVNSFQKSFFRNVVALSIAAAAWWRTRDARRETREDERREANDLRSEVSRVSCLKSSHVLSLKSKVLLLLRSVLGTVGIFANFYALSNITIAEGQTLNKTAPFFTVLLAWLFLGERATRRQLLPLLVAFAGVVLIAKPGFAGSDAFPLAMGVLGGVCAGGAYACVRGLRRHDVSPAFIILFFSAFSCLSSVPFMVTRFDPMTGRQVLILFGAGAGAALGQFGITLAYGFAAPREIAVYDYANILFTAAFGLLFFGQVPDGWSIAGVIAILLAAYRMFR